MCTFGRSLLKDIHGAAHSAQRARDKSSNPGFFHFCAHQAIHSRKWLWSTVSENYKTCLMQDRVFHMLLGDKYFIWNILMPPLFTNKQLVRDHVLVIVLVPCRALGTVQIKWRSVNVTPSWSSSQVQRSSWWHHVLWKRHVAVTIHWPSVKLTVTLRRTVKERHKLEAHGVPFPTTARFLSSPLGGSHPFPTNLTDIKKSASLAFDFV